MGAYSVRGSSHQDVWYSLVGETQFATELTLTGLRRLCSVPTAPDLHYPWGGGRDQKYPLHVGMYSYASGLERLCKLAIACNGYAVTGKFPSLRKYSHRIGLLLDAVGDLSTPPSSPGPSDREEKYLARPYDELDPDLMNTVEQFASGAGRYEQLDVLWNDKAELNTYNAWSSLAVRSSVSEEVRRLISLKDATAYAIGAELANNGLESSASTLMEDLELPMYLPSVGVVLSLFRKVRWVSTILGVATYYTREDLPFLGEVVSPTFVHTSADFFNYSIARFSDDAVVEEELVELYKRINLREAEMDDEDFEDEIGVET